MTRRMFNPAALAVLAMLVIGLASACGGSTCPTPEEQTYLAAVPILHEEAAMGAESVSELFAQASADPTLLTSEAWKVDVAVALSRMETGARGVVDRDAPASLSQIDGLHKSSAAQVLEAVDLYRGAVGQLDAASMTAAKALLTSAAEDRAKAASATKGVLREVAVNTLARPEGFEPTTPGSEDQCSIH